MQFAPQESIIRERAYSIWEQEGRPDGREWDHWIQASQEIEARRPPAYDPQATATNRPARKKAGARGKLRLALKSAMS
jgi:hypothetical protein